jgi:hypothetical protein
MPAEPLSPLDSKPDPQPIPLPAGAREIRLRGELPPGISAAVQVEARGEDGAWFPAGQARLSGPPARGLKYWRAWLLRDWDGRLFWIALGLYLAVRLIALPDFPIYFFGDEAIQANLAADLVRDGLHGYSGELLPSYFANAGQYNLSVSVYLQVVPTLLFGKAVWVTRGVPALLSLLAALGVGLALREGLGVRRAWLGILALSAAPAWLLHSRTAFETALAVDFFAVFLCVYLLYRQGRTRWIYAAAPAAALCFYSYSPAQIVIGAACLFFFFSDLGYHWKQRRVLLPVLGLALLLAVPYARQQILHPDTFLNHLAILNSYWTEPIPLGAKLVKAGGIYLRGLDPVYWFLPHTHDLPRHSMDGWAHLLRWTFPFYFVGLGAALWKIRRAEYRALLLALLACPLGAVPVDLGITRVLCLAVPGALLTALGFDAAIEFIGRLRGGSYAGWLRPASAAACLLALGLASPLLLRSALVDGPFWYSDYGLGGMQYGAPQVFAAIQAELKTHPGRPVVLSPTWANSADVLARYFFPDPAPLALNSLRTYTETYTPFPPETLFILPAEEYRALPREMFTGIQVERTLSYPNGQPGFYFLRLAYAPDAQQILAQQREARAAPLETTLDINSATVKVLHTRLDIGEILHAFDGDANTLVRTESANPLVIELTFPAAQQLSGITVRVGGVPTTLRVRAIVAGETGPRSWEQVLPEDPLPRDAAIDFGAPLAIQNLRIEILNTNDPPEAHVHLWEIWLH